MEINGLFWPASGRRKFIDYFGRSLAGEIHRLFWPASGRRKFIDYFGRLPGQRILSIIMIIRRPSGVLDPQFPVSLDFLVFLVSKILRGGAQAPNITRLGSPSMTLVDLWGSLGTPRVLPARPFGTLKSNLSTLLSPPSYLFTWF